MTDAGYAQILALRRRMARLEELAKAAAQAPDKPTPGFGDALRQVARDGTASGSAIDALKRAVEGTRPTTTAPDPERLREATRVATANLRGSASIEGAYADMQTRAARRNVVETASPGALGRVDPTDPATAAAIDRLDRVLKGR